MEKTRILYLAGWGRSGSTLLANILGQIEGFFSIGEILSVWDTGFVRNRTCSCGKPFRQCEFWSRVAEDIRNHRPAVQADRWHQLSRSETRTRSLLKFFLSEDLRRRSPSLREYLSVTEQVYSSVKKVSGCRIIVDTSHTPFYGRLLRLIPSIEVCYVHLIRDPRAASYSWSVPKQQPDGPMRRIGTVKSSLLWMIWNLASEWLCRRNPARVHRIRYEDFIRRPRGTVEGILQFLHEPPSATPFLSETSVFLKPNHMVRGNPCRFQIGTTELLEDIRWKTEMSRANRLVTELITWPLAGRYGYSYFYPQFRKVPAEEKKT